MGDAVQCVLIGDVPLLSSGDELVVLLSLYFFTDVLLINAHAINFDFRLCLQCHPVGDVVPRSLMGDVVP